MRHLIPVKDLGRQLKPGDHVLIREDIKRGDYYRRYDGGIMGTSRDMEGYRNEEAEIVKDAFSDSFYRINLDHGEWKWVDGMFSGVYVEAEDLGDIEAQEFDLASLFGGT